MNSECFVRILVRERKENGNNISTDLLAKIVLHYRYLAIGEAYLTSDKSLEFSLTVKVEG